MANKKHKQTVFSVEVRGETEELYEIEAEDADAAEKIGKEWFREAHGDSFESISAVAESDED